MNLNDWRIRLGGGAVLALLAVLWIVQGIALYRGAAPREWVDRAG